MRVDEVREQLERRLKTLSRDLWEDRCREPDIEEWLSNFDGRHSGDPAMEKLRALHLLSSVSYFGLRELRVLLRSMYRDLFRYPIIQKVRRALGGTTDAMAVQRRFVRELESTRFIGMGNPAESGTHLLYYFRQENDLNPNLFPHQHELLTGHALDPGTTLIEPLKRLVFVDDLCGSGGQSVRYSETVIADLQAIAARSNRSIEFHYLVLFGTEGGLAKARADSAFDLVDAVTELDATYVTFGPRSRVFRRPPPYLNLAQSKELAENYGGELWSRWPLGFGDCQLLLAFHHNIPNNSLPILWWSRPGDGWKAVFPRHTKRSRSLR